MGERVSCRIYNGMDVNIMEYLEEVRERVNELFEFTNGNIPFLRKKEDIIRANKLSNLARELVIKFSITFGIDYMKTVDYLEFLEEIGYEERDLSDDQVWNIIHEMYMFSFTFFDEQLEVVEFRSVIDNFSINKNFKEVRDIDCFEEKYAKLKNEK